MSKLKEQLAKSMALHRLSLELATYNKAAAVNDKFKNYYQGKAEGIEAQIKELTGG